MNNHIIPSTLEALALISQRRLSRKSFLKIFFSRLTQSGSTFHIVSEPRGVVFEPSGRLVLKQSLLVPNSSAKNCSWGLRQSLFKSQNRDVSEEVWLIATPIDAYCVKQSFLSCEDCHRECFPHSGRQHIRTTTSDFGTITHMSFGRTWMIQVQPRSEDFGTSASSDVSTPSF
jgi:hypothetical protein